MTRDEQQQFLIALCVLALLYELHQEPVAQPGGQPRSILQRGIDALERGGAAAADMFDPQHQRDLPGHQLTKQAVLTLATQAGFPDPKLAAAIAYAESGGVTNVINQTDREFSVGLWQINTKVHPYSWWDMQDPVKNAAAAFLISKGGTDWTPWSAYTHGTYQLFKTGIYR